MTGIVDKIKNVLPDDCQPCDCDKDNCSVLMTNVPHYHVVLNMDCHQIKSRINGDRCDCLFVGEFQGQTWIIPIELKSGRVDLNKVRDQLQGGARYAETYLTDKDQFDFMVVLAYNINKPITQEERFRLQKKHVTIKGRKRTQPKVIQCGDSLAEVLPVNMTEKSVSPD